MPELFSQKNKIGLRKQVLGDSEEHCLKAGLMLEGTKISLNLNLNLN